MTHADPLPRSRPGRMTRVGLAVAAVVASVLAVSAGTASPAAASSATEADFGSASGYQTFTVPSGVTSLHLSVVGGAGADGALVDSTCSTDSSGSAGWMAGTLRVTPGEALRVWVGGGGHLSGPGGTGTPDGTFAGGHGGQAGTGLTSTGGGGNGGGGGAASVVWAGGVDESNIVAVGGGGGGGGGEGAAVYECGGRGGNGGLPSSSGANATTAGSDSSSAGSGVGGVSNALDFRNHSGYDGGTPPEIFDGVVGFGGGGGGGGAGMKGSCGCGAGGGGGTSVDGGDGSAGGGGGGGSSYAADSVTDTFFSSAGAHGSPGSVTFTWGAPSSILLSAGLADAGQAVSLHAFVDGIDGGGAVAFTSDGKTIDGCGALPFSSGGGTSWEATCTTTGLPAGVHEIAATYSGDTAFAGSATSTFETIRQPTTTTVTTTPGSSVTAGDDITIDALLGRADGGGTTAFTDDGTVVGGCGSVKARRAVQDGEWHAVCSTTAPAAGSHAIRAEFSGDSIDYGSAGTAALTVVARPSLPGAPVLGTVVAQDGSATVEFTAPSADGGSPITGYVVTATPLGGGVPVVGRGTASPITLTGLSNGTTYTATVAAVSAAGTGPASDPSDEFMPVSRLVITSPSQQPTYVVGSIVSSVLHAEGGSGIEAWSLAPGSTLPAGLQLTSDGTISGRPTSPVTNHLFTVRVADVVSGTQSATKQMSMSVAAAPSPDLRVTLGHTGNFATGRSGTYTLTVANVGRADTRGLLTARVTLPRGLVAKSGAGTGWSCHAAGTTETCTRSRSLAAGASSRLTVTVHVTAAAGRQLVTTARIAPTDQHPANNASSDTVRVVRR
jgi:hypothetical protein